MDDFLSSIVGEPAVRYNSARQGISKSDFLSIVTETGMNLTEFSSLLPVSKRTIEKVKNEELLNPQVSDRVIQIATLFQFGKILFGTTQSFREWLYSSVFALGGKKPIEYLDNETGISMVRDLLGRIEHGVYS